MSNSTDSPSEPGRTGRSAADNALASNTTADGPLVPDPSPGGVEADGKSETRPEPDDRRKPDEATPEAPETDRERHHRQSD